ncbi:MAG: penicillin-binding protein [Candidatus Binatia bacterium]
MRRGLKAVRFRLGLTSAIFLMMFLAVGLRAFQLQILQGEKLMRLGERQHLQEWIILPRRGSMLDRSGEPLAISLEAQSVYVRPQRLKKPEVVAPRLARALDMSLSQVRRSLNRKKPFVWLKRQVTPREAKGVRALRLSGVGMYYEPKRYYPQGRLAGQVIGFVGSDSQGLEGVERYYDTYFRGESGSSVIERDGLGRMVMAQGVGELDIPPGANIHMTLDITIQHLVEKQLETAIIKSRAKAGVALMVEPFTGEVLALANYPFFNPNRFARLPSHRWRNRAVTDSYEPGSTFKAILAAAALEEGIVGKEDIFYCEYGRYAFGGKVIHDTKRHGWLPFSKIIEYSSNIGAVKVAEKMKKEKYFQYIQKFGFGQTTGIDLPGEANGLVRRPSRWSRMDLAAHAFGQGIGVTPIQLVMAYAAIANGGILMRPYVVQRVVGPRGEVLLTNQPRIVRRVISEKTARVLTSILKKVVREGGTGVKAGVEGFQVAGKTGTAQKADLIYGGYAPEKKVVSFIGFVPADDPRLVLLVLLDEPQDKAYGGLAAAPVFRKIARGTLRHLRAMPENPEPPPGIAAGDLIRVKPKNGKRLKRAEGVSGVPDFLGLSMREAITKARDMKLQVEIQGNGYVVRQSPTPGSNWGKRGTLALTLQG